MTAIKHIFSDFRCKEDNVFVFCESEFYMISILYDGWKERGGRLDSKANSALSLSFPSLSQTCENLICKIYKIIPFRRNSGCKMTPIRISISDKCVVTTTGFFTRSCLHLSGMTDLLILNMRVTCSCYKAQVQNKQDWPLLCYFPSDCLPFYFCLKVHHRKYTK